MRVALKRLCILREEHYGTGLGILRANFIGVGTKRVMCFKTGNFDIGVDRGIMGLIIWSVSINLRVFVLRLDI